MSYNRLFIWFQIIVSGKVWNFSEIISGKVSGNAFQKTFSGKFSRNLSGNVPRTLCSESLPETIPEKLSGNICWTLLRKSLPETLQGKFPRHFSARTFVNHVARMTWSCLDRQTKQTKAFFINSPFLGGYNARFSDPKLDLCFFVQNMSFCYVSYKNTFSCHIPFSNTFLCELFGAAGHCAMIARKLASLRYFSFRQICRKTHLL